MLSYSIISSQILTAPEYQTTSRNFYLILINAYLKTPIFFLKKMQQPASKTISTTCIPMSSLYLQRIPSVHANSKLSAGPYVHHICSGLRLWIIHSQCPFAIVAHPIVPIGTHPQGDPPVVHHPQWLHLHQEVVLINMRLDEQHNKKRAPTGREMTFRHSW
jgi:hypothetical protein